tara:strand:+ start:997 stop:1647 length:651 start_codon:yes stop_codon:yes gene_type:complete
MNISENLKKIKKSIPKEVLLVAVSKTKPVDYLKIAYKSGQLDFGENKIQELILKHETLPKNIRWHMIGHLQTNKVKYIASFVYLIHSVDSLKLIKEINKQGKKINRIINILIQVDISNDSTKYGFSMNEINKLLCDNIINNFNFISLKGFMGMASFTSNLEIIENQFKSLNGLFEKHKSNYSLTMLSMGMSGDYKIAIRNNSNIIRLGSNVFGKRI